MNSSATVTGCDHIERLLDMVAAPTPPVVLPPLSKGINDKVKEFANACAFGGRDERVEADMALTREIRSYARAALAQYGIKEQSDE